MAVSWAVGVVFLSDLGLAHLDKMRHLASAMLSLGAGTLIFPCSLPTNEQLADVPGMARRADFLGNRSLGGEHRNAAGGLELHPHRTGAPASGPASAMPPLSWPPHIRVRQDRALLSPALWCGTADMLLHLPFVTRLFAGARQFRSRPAGAAAAAAAAAVHVAVANVARGNTAFGELEGGKSIVYFK